MPIYEYKCNNCGAKVERLQKISEQPLKNCPECEQSELVRLVSAAGFILKGTGWYVTDFRDKDKAGAQSEADGSRTSENYVSANSTKDSDKKDQGNSKDVDQVNKTKTGEVKESKENRKDKMTETAKSSRGSENNSNIPKAFQDATRRGRR